MTSHPDINISEGRIVPTSTSHFHCFLFLLPTCHAGKRSLKLTPERDSSVQAENIIEAARSKQPPAAKNMPALGPPEVVARVAVEMMTRPS